jgi:FtsH-binding integral membrane protein
MVAILVGVFVPSNIYYIIISAIAAVLFSAYLLFDLQAIMGGRMLEMLPDDYIYAAVQVSMAAHYRIADDYCRVLSLVQAG